MRFIDLPTRQKLLMVFALFTTLLLFILVIASFLLLTMVSRQETLYRDDLGTVLSLERVDSLFQRNRSLVLEMALIGANIEQNIKETEDGARTAIDLLATVEVALADQPHLQELFREYRRIYDAYRQTRSDIIFPALRQGRPDEAVAAMTGIQLQRYNRISELSREITTTALRNAESAVTRANENAYRTVAVFIVIGILAVLLGIISAAKLTRMITTPLNRITDHAGEIAAGNLAIAIDREERQDEFGTLGNAFGRMVESLRELSRELRDGINVLASSGSQILAATTEMASGAAQTATSVNETTATVEEVKQTAHLAAEKSQHVADIAQRAVQASQAGRGAVDEAVEGMRQIMEQMEAVTDSIVRLSELSQTIGGIITTVNDLAEQSNLLAVNAAIEAAKAGEHGKGFAVVAQEVRHLAGQSKQATAQVQGILGDIQKATSASVMATEQGTKAVETGMRQSSRAGEAIRTLSETVEEAATAALQITASSKEQLVGMDQIALAMQNIKTATSQQVAGTRQTEEASMKIHDLGKRLKELAARFRV
jgi:methyl-accepting chemotaxis protein